MCMCLCVCASVCMSLCVCAFLSLCCFMRWALARARACSCVCVRVCVCACLCVVVFVACFPAYCSIANVSTCNGLQGRPASDGGRRGCLSGIPLKPRTQIFAMRAMRSGLAPHGRTCYLCRRSIVVDHACATLCITHVCKYQDAGCYSLNALRARVAGPLDWSTQNTTRTTQRTQRGSAKQNAERCFHNST